MTNNQGVFVVAASGDFATELHLLNRALILDLSATSSNQATSQVYPSRSMDADADEYVLAELDRNDFAGARLTYTLFDRRLEFYALVNRFESRLVAIRDRDSNLSSLRMISMQIHQKA